MLPIAKNTVESVIDELALSNGYQRPSDEMIMVPKRMLGQLALPNSTERGLGEANQLIVAQNTLMEQVLALANGDDMDTRDMVSVMSVAAIVIMSMVMLFQSMSTTMLLKRLM
jgi:hypothetical protein